MNFFFYVYKRRLQLDTIFCFNYADERFIGSLIKIATAIYEHIFIYSRDNIAILLVKLVAKSHIII